MLRFDEGVAVVQKGGRGGGGPYCQNLRPRYRSTHRHTLEEPRERGREEKEREGSAKERKGEKDWVQKCDKKEEGKKDASRKPREGRFISVMRASCQSTSSFRASPRSFSLFLSITRTRCG